jgi:hypothetical protein
MINSLIEILVCVLLTTTIGYCIVLDRRLRALKADETLMRKVITDLVGATDRAERAVAGLRSIVVECDETISGRLRDAERHSDDLAAHIRSGDDVIARIARIVESASGGRPLPVARAAEPVSAPEPIVPAARERVRDTLAAAQAFAERAQRRVQGGAR